MSIKTSRLILVIALVALVLFLFLPNLSWATAGRQEESATQVSSLARGLESNQHNAAYFRDGFPHGHSSQSLCPIFIYS